MSTLPERLKEQTRPLHEATEQLLYINELRNGTLSPDAYVHLLRTHLAFHQALEDAMARFPDFGTEYNLEARRKADWLVADLTRLEQTVPTPMPELFANWSPVELLGAAYVSEGSMLGGKFVWQMLQQNPAILSLLTDARFYQGYGKDTGRLWKEFLVFLQMRGENQADTVVEAAERAFRAYQTCFQRTMPVYTT
ncbi:biliverdin-producing heme oxygenase [Spirosoma sp. KUDC1026]|uniref:biliverdin-producing heme oxygenase n=1 Tax=Spirosoma sp. KUDC1026 TaxID=2745947 RepID=UPI00159BEB2E|nr:biliverdin-producing heme oxygenase [Spirosoma sp. KUDC1026]QKZ14008.1 biliverdin-producing heme oxygenase [Spirosoma sp. KUDC1026]